MNNEYTKILVFYIGVAGVRKIDVEDTVKRIASSITPEKFEGEIIIIPTQNYDTRVEMINPVYITEEELIKKNSELMSELKSHLEFQLKEIKNK